MWHSWGWFIEHTSSFDAPLCSLSLGLSPALRALHPPTHPTAIPQAQFLCAARLPCLPLGKEMRQCKYIRPLAAPWLITLMQKHGHSEEERGGWREEEAGGGADQRDNWMFIIIHATFSPALIMKVLSSVLFLVVRPSRPWCYFSSFEGHSFSLVPVLSLSSLHDCFADCVLVFFFYRSAVESRPFFPLNISLAAVSYFRSCDKKWAATVPLWNLVHYRRIQIYWISQERSLNSTTGTKLPACCALWQIRAVTIGL